MMSSEEEERGSDQQQQKEEEVVVVVEGLEPSNTVFQLKKHTTEPPKNHIAEPAKNHATEPALLNRRGKIVNGTAEVTKQKAAARKSFEANRKRSKKGLRKGRDTHTGSDSGLGEGSESELIKSGSDKRSSEARRARGKKGGKTPGGTAIKKDDMTRLEKELEQEMRYRDTIQWSVVVLQQSVDELSQQLEGLEQGDHEEGSSEFKLRFEAQERLNAKLEEQSEWYQGEVNKTRDKIKKGQEYTFDQDLDQYNEFELLRLVKSLERERNNLYSDLRGHSWLLDNQSKEYYHLKELIRAYTGDLTMVNRSLEQLWRQRSLSRDSAFTGASTPVTSPGGVKWSKLVLGPVGDESGQSGIRPSQRILDPRKGPIRKTAGVRSLPRLDQEALDHYTTSGTLFRKARSRSRGRRTTRAKSLDTRKEDLVEPDVVAPLSPVLRAKSEEGQSLRSSSGVFDESYEASNEASTTASVELG